MKNPVYIFLLSIFANISFGAELLDVNILETNKSKNGIEVKLQVKNAPKNAFFYVDITRDDPDAFDKLILITSKLEKPKNIKLNLSIPSFSLLPSGSFYKSTSVTMSNTSK